MWKKQISGQTIPQAPESQLGDDWRKKVRNATKESCGANTEALLDGSGVRTATVEAQEQGKETITILRQKWEQVIRTIQTLRANQDEMHAQYIEIHCALHNGERRIEVLENERATQSATVLRRHSTPGPAMAATNLANNSDGLTRSQQGSVMKRSHKNQPSIGREQMENGRNSTERAHTREATPKPKSN